MLEINKKDSYIIYSESTQLYIDIYRVNQYMVIKYSGIIREYSNVNTHFIITIGFRFITKCFYFYFDVSPK